MNNPAGFAKVRFVNSWIDVDGATFNLTIDGVNNATVTSGEVINGGYYLLSNTVTYNFTIANGVSAWMSAYNQSFGNGAYTFWLIGSYAYGGYYNGTGSTNTLSKRLIDGAAAPQVNQATTPFPSATSLGTTAPSSTTMKPSSSGGGLLSLCVVVAVSALALVIGNANVI